MPHEIVILLIPKTPIRFENRFYITSLFEKFRSKPCCGHSIPDCLRVIHDRVYTFHSINRE